MFRWKVGIITGGISEIGLATAGLLAKEGKAEQEQNECKQEATISLDQQLEMIQLKQDLGQKLTPEEESLLQEHSSTYSSLEMAQLKHDIGKELNPVEQDLLHQHDQLKGSVS